MFYLLKVKTFEISNIWVGASECVCCYESAAAHAAASAHATAAAHVKRLPRLPRLPRLQRLPRLARLTSLPRRARWASIERSVTCLAALLPAVSETFMLCE